MHVTTTPSYVTPVMAPGVALSEFSTDVGTHDELATHVTVLNTPSVPQTAEVMSK